MYGSIAASPSVPVIALNHGVVVGIDVGDIAERVQQQLRRRVVVDDRLGRDLPQQPVVREVLGLRERMRAAVRAARRRGARTLVVETPRGRVVAVRVDAVLTVAEGPVAVVVAHRLAPQAVGRLAQRGVRLRVVRRANDAVGGLVDVGAAQRVVRVGHERRAAHLVDAGAEAGAAGERVVVAVRVLDRQEPQLVAAQQLGDLRVVGVLDPPGRHPPAHLGRDPLARVVDRGEQHRRARAVGDVARVLGHLQRDDVLAPPGLADHHQLREPRVGEREALHLVLDAAGLRVGAEDVIERVGRVAARLRLVVRACRRAAALGGLEPLLDLGLADVRPRRHLLSASPSARPTRACASNRST